MLTFLIVSYIYVTLKDSIFLSFKAEFSDLHQSLGVDKAWLRWDEGSALQSSPCQQASLAGRLMRWCGLDLAFSKCTRLTDSKEFAEGMRDRVTFQIHLISTASVTWSRWAVFRARWLQSDCLQLSPYVTSTVVMSKCQAAAGRAWVRSAHQEGA